MEDIVIIGFGGHAKSVIDAIESQKKYNIIGFTENQYKQPYKGYSYLGNDDVLENLYKSGIKNAHVATGYMGSSKIRDIIYTKLKTIGFMLPVIIDSSAVVASDVIIEEGSFIGKLSVVNSDAHIGKMCIVNTGSIIEHECCLGDFSHLAVGAIMCGNVSVDEHSFIGSGTTIIQGSRIGSGVIVGAGSTVLGNVKANEKVYGIIKSEREV